MRYELGVTCPRCGTELDHENATPQSRTGRRSVAIVKCPKLRCGRRYEVRAELIDWRDDLVPLPAPEPVQ